MTTEETWELYGNEIVGTKRRRRRDWEDVGWVGHGSILSGDGNTLVEAGGGKIDVYTYIGGQWVPKGPLGDISFNALLTTADFNPQDPITYCAAAQSSFGTQMGGGTVGFHMEDEGNLKVSKDGNTIAIGNPCKKFGHPLGDGGKVILYNYINGVKVYFGKIFIKKYDTVQNKWINKGNVLEGEWSDMIGESLCLSDDGNTISYLVTHPELTLANLGSFSEAQLASGIFGGIVVRKYNASLNEWVKTKYFKGTTNDFDFNWGETSSINVSQTINTPPITQLSVGAISDNGSTNAAAVGDTITQMDNSGTVVTAGTLMTPLNGYINLGAINVVTTLGAFDDTLRCVVNGGGSNVIVTAVTGSAPSTDYSPEYQEDDGNPFVANMQKITITPTNAGGRMGDTVSQSATGATGKLVITDGNTSDTIWVSVTNGTFNLSPISIIGSIEIHWETPPFPASPPATYLTFRRYPYVGDQLGGLAGDIVTQMDGSGVVIATGVIYDGFAEGDEYFRVIPDAGVVFQDASHMNAHTNRLIIQHSRQMAGGGEAAIPTWEGDREKLQHVMSRDGEVIITKCKEEAKYGIKLYKYNEIREPSGHALAPSYIATITSAHVAAHPSLVPYENY